MLSTSFVPYSMEWIREHHKHNCPQHGGIIPDCWVKASKYCPACGRFWRMRRSKYSGIAMWYVVTLSPAIKSATYALRGKLSGNLRDSQS